MIPNGLAIKLYPCCYALQRPIAALAVLAPELDPAAVRRIVLRTPEATVVPLIHHRPRTDDSMLNALLADVRQDYSGPVVLGEDLTRIEV